MYLLYTKLWALCDLVENSVSSEPFDHNSRSLDHIGKMTWAVTRKSANQIHVSTDTLVIFSYCSHCRPICIQLEITEIEYILDDIVLHCLKYTQICWILINSNKAWKNFLDVLREVLACDQWDYPLKFLLMLSKHCLQVSEHVNYDFCQRLYTIRQNIKKPPDVLFPVQQFWISLVSKSVFQFCMRFFCGTREIIHTHTFTHKHQVGASQ